MERYVLDKYTDRLHSLPKQIALRNLYLRFIILKNQEIVLL